MQQITELERRALDLYSAAFTRESARISLLMELTGMSQVDSLLWLNDLIDTEHAAAYAPTVVRRLQRTRTHRSLSRRHRVA